MGKKYISVRGSLFQDMVDNWLLMIPDERLSSDSKIVYIVLKKIQSLDMKCNTDANSWKKISGMNFAKVKECFLELQRFGLIEIYFSTKNISQWTTTFTCYLLYHYLMKDSYKIIDCPHDEDSFSDALSIEHILRNNTIATTIKEFKEAVQGQNHVHTDESIISN